MVPHKFSFLYSNLIRHGSDVNLVQVPPQCVFPMPSTLMQLHRSDGGYCPNSTHVTTAPAPAGMLAQLTQQVALAFVTTKTLAFAAISLGTLGSVTFPAISSIKANNVLDSEQVGV